VPKRGPKTSSYRGEPPKSLTATERVILRALRDGATLVEIAHLLGRSELTVRTHIRNARAKLGIRGTAELRRRLAAGELDAAIIAEPERD
jgi:DNA-binding CsgD family transcriptional regulator